MGARVRGVAVLFGTSITHYATFMPSYAHAMDAFACGAFVVYWATTIGDLRLRRFLLLGALVGASALIRVTGFALGAALAVELVATAIRPPPAAQGARARHVAALALRGAVALAAAIAVFAPQMIAWQLMFGELLTSPMGPKFVRLEHPQVLETLFSSRNGWLSTHPLAYAGLLGLVFVPRRARLVALGLLPVVALMVWVNAAAADWWAGASFGNRRLAR